jgi:hypothetical protein
MVPHGDGCNMPIRRAASGGHRRMAAGRWPFQQVLQAQPPPVHLQSTQVQSVHGQALPVGVAASTAGESLRSLEMFMGVGLDDRGGVPRRAHWSLPPGQGQSLVFARPGWAIDA